MPKGIRHGGRQKGTPNKKTADLFALCEKRGVVPFEKLLEFMSHPDPSFALRATEIACSYLYPKRKQIELSEDPDAPIGEALAEKATEKIFEYIKSNERSGR